MKKFILTIIFMTTSIAYARSNEVIYARSNDIATKYILEKSGNLFRIMKGNNLKCAIATDVDYIRGDYHSLPRYKKYSLIFYRRAKIYGLLVNKNYNGYKENSCPKATGHIIGDFDREYKKNISKSIIIKARYNDIAKYYILERDGHLYRIMKGSNLKCNITKGVNKIRVQYNENSDVVLYILKKQGQYVKTYTLHKNPFKSINGRCPPAYTDLSNTAYIPDYLDKEEEYTSGFVAGMAGMLLLMGIF